MHRFHILTPWAPGRSSREKTCRDARFRSVSLQNDWILPDWPVGGPTVEDSAFELCLILLTQDDILVCLICPDPNGS